MTKQAHGSQFEVRTDDSSGQGSAIWVVLDGVAFPENGWTDFPLIVLDWWAQSTLQLLENKADSVEWRFMDGPFWLEIEARGSSNVRLRRQTERGPVTVKEGTISVTLVASSLVRAIEGILKTDAVRIGDSARLSALAVAAKQLSTAVSLLV